MSAFLCEHCGASLHLPSAEESALDVECTFCNGRTRVPEDVMALRRKPASLAVPARRGPLPPALIPSAVAGGLLTLLVALVFVTSAKPLPKATVAPQTSATPSASATPPRAPITDRRLTGEDAVSARLAELHARGCKDVILAPTRGSGEQTIETKLVKGGRCVTVVAMTGIPENELTLRMSTPLGAPIAMPAPSASLEVQVCPTMTGQHPSTISPKTDDPYTVAAIECPAPAGVRK